MTAEKEFNKPLYICFMDITTAFDQVRLKDTRNCKPKQNTQENRKANRRPKQINKYAC